jgi:hypothetical protein
MKITTAFLLLVLPIFSCAQDRAVLVEEPSADQKAAIEAAEQSLRQAQEQLDALTNAPLAPSNNPYRTVVCYANPGTGGNVSGGGTYPRYTYVQIIANPNAGWFFTKWNDGVTNAVRTFVLRTNISFTAYFSQTPPPPTTSYVTVGWNGVTGCTNYYVSYGPSHNNYTKRVTANNQTKKQLQVGLPSTNYISVQAIDFTTGLVSAYSSELIYTAP